ncbi:MAG TPA: hypothetical protein VFX59_13625 [Polyangiales bacterium]|nr:hypothetical protein [Polyangiales bacterium]
MSSLPKSRPLLVREGARYTCFGDGLCCTDIHALGPVTRKEKAEVELLEPGALVRHKDLGQPVFKVDEDTHACVLRSTRGCELHARHGAEAKPAGCIRFPYGLIATPEGGRITTEHRCPCRTLGARPPLSVDDALGSLVDSIGRLSPNGRVGPRVQIADGKTLAFARYRAVEAQMIGTLLLGADPLQVFDVKPFGKLEDVKWKKIVPELKEDRDGSAYGEALMWFGEALVALLDDDKLKLGERPWQASFDRAEARSPIVESYQAVLNDWLADLLWSMDWVFSTRSFHAGRRELATLYCIALTITKRLIRAKVRGDRAAAEAITIVELARQSGAWEKVQLAL